MAARQVELGDVPAFVRLGTAPRHNGGQDDQSHGVVGSSEGLEHFCFRSLGGFRGTQVDPRYVQTCLASEHSCVLLAWKPS